MGSTIPNLFIFPASALDALQSLNNFALRETASLSGKSTLVGSNAANDIAFNGFGSMRIIIMSGLVT